jgi:hypothetical protein
LQLCNKIPYRGKHPDNAVHHLNHVNDLAELNLTIHCHYTAGNYDSNETHHAYYAVHAIQHGLVYGSPHSRCSDAEIGGCIVGKHAVA